MPKPNSFILYLDALRVIIASGFARASRNDKTENMIQVWTLRRDQDPVTANWQGKDRVICGKCPLRGDKRKGIKRRCYVTLAHSPLAIWKKFNAGGYTRLPDYSLFDGRSVRFGAYGESTYLPLPSMERIISRASNFTGYTHRWQEANIQAYKPFLMASVESPSLAMLARSMGWRTFRIVTHPSDVLVSHEILCPHYTRGLNCEDCGLCCGSSIQAKSIANPPHGNQAKAFFTS